MAKKKTQSAFFCQSCGTQSPKWLGKCPQCNEWNTFVEEIISKDIYKVKRMRGKKKDRDRVEKEQIYGNQDDNRFQIKLTYKQVNNYIDLPIIERKIKYYLTTLL